MAHLILETHLARGEMPARLAIMIGFDSVPPPSALAFFHRLLQRLEKLIDEGVAAGEFAPCDGPVTAAAVCDCLITIPRSGRRAARSQHFHGRGDDEKV